jgi:hypothetical protein
MFSKYIYIIPDLLEANLLQTLKCQWLRLSEYSHSLMKKEISLMYSHRTATGTYSDSVQSSLTPNQLKFAIISPMAPSSPEYSFPVSSFN